MPTDGIRLNSIDARPGVVDYPQCPLYLFYGTQHNDVLKARDAVIDKLLPKEDRNENLTEYYPTNQQENVRLAASYDEIAGDLATVSFIPGASKCVTVTNPAEVFGSSSGRGGKKTAPKAEQRMLKWLETGLPETGHFVILLALEDESSQRMVNKNSAVYKIVQKIGYLQGFSTTPAFFLIEDALIGRQTSLLLKSLRDLWKPGKGDSDVYRAVLRCLRYMLQANIARDRNATKDAAAQAMYFPCDAQRNLFKASPFVSKKYLNTRQAYRTIDLLNAYQGLLDVYRAMRPRPDDLFVPDARGLIEETLVKLIISPRPRQSGR